MEKITGNESIHSVAASYSDDNPQVLVPTDGLTIRQHFAAMAMQGLAANSIPGPQHNAKIYAAEAVEIADALIAELNKPTKP